MATKEFSLAFVPTTFSTDERGLLAICPNCYPKPLSSVTGHTVGSWGPWWEGVIVTGKEKQIKEICEELHIRPGC